MGKRINLNFPDWTPPQRRIAESKKRFNVGVWARQTGKTTFGIDKMTYKPPGIKNGVFWFILQTFTTAAVAFDRHCRMLHRHKELLRKKPHESNLIIPFTGGSNLFYKSGEVADDLRSETLDGCIIDECRQQDPKLWAIVRPMLGRRNGWCDFFSTPNGFDWFYDLYNEGLTNPLEWGTFHAPATEAPWWTPDEIASLRRTMSEAMFAQEMLAEFRDIAQGKAYLNFTRDHVTEINPCAANGELFSPYLPIIVGMDFNLSPMCWSLGQKRADKWFWFDEICLTNSHTPEAARELIARVVGHAPGLILAGDATSKAGQRAAAGQSDYDILCQELDRANIRFVNKTPDSNPSVKDRINTVNAKFKSADGTVRMWVHPRCKNLRRDFERVVWKQGSQAILDQTKDPTLTHASDGVGYAVCALDPISGIQSKPKLVFVR